MSKAVSFTGGQWVEESSRPDGGAIFAAFMALVFSIALVSAVMHPADKFELQGDAVAFSGP